MLSKTDISSKDGVDNSDKTPTPRGDHQTKVSC